MRAAVIAGPSQIQVREVPVPQPGPEQVRIRLEGCGVCHSNIPPFEGRPSFKYPMPAGAPGHEGWGVVDQVGSRVKGFKVGDRVASISENAFAEYDVADAGSLICLPQMLAQVPFPGEPIACAINIFRRSCIKSTDTVAIVGIGFQGALLTRLATTAGARVIAIARRRCALDIARSMGADETIAIDEPGRIVQHVMDKTNGKLCDVVIEAVGKQKPLDLAGELTRVRGRLVIAGYHQDGLRQVNMQLWNWRGIDVINAHERDPKIFVAGMQEAVEEVAAGRIDPLPLFTHRFPLERLEEALAMTRDRPDGFLKALIVL